MKAYVNINSVVVGIGENDSLFLDCDPIEITEEEKIFIESCKSPKHIDSIFIESFTLADENAEKIKKAIDIDLEYTDKIGFLMVKHVNKTVLAMSIGEIYVIPQSALNEVQILKDECNEKILALGITDFSYRQSVPKLAKTETINK